MAYFLWKTYAAIRERFARLLGTERYPNLAVTEVEFDVAKIINQYSADLKITGVVKNIGPADFNYNGVIKLFRGPQLLKSKPFGKMPRGSSIKIEYISEHESCIHGPVIPGYTVKIEYDPTILTSMNQKDIDGDFNNNEKEISPIAICNKINTSFISYYRGKLLSLINQYRNANGEPPLNFDSCLNKLAQDHSEYMHSIKKMTHYGKSGTKVNGRCVAVGCCAYGTCGENVHAGNMNPQDCFDSWKGSPGHNDNMLGGYTKIGIGIAFGYVTADFD